MMSEHWILEGHEPKQVDLFTWAKWFESADRHVAKTNINENIKVSTVFLGIDHSFGDEGSPILFETMIFGGTLDEEMDRYSTWDEAAAGHKQMVLKAKAALDAQKSKT